MMQGNYVGSIAGSSCSPGVGCLSSGGGSLLFARPRPASFGSSSSPPPHHHHHHRRRTRLTDEEAAEVDHAFDRLSAGQTDEATNEPLATPRQLKLALRAFGFPVKKADVRSLLRDLGLDADAPLSRAEFLEAAASKLLERTPQEDAARAFALFDVAGRGRVGVEELRAVARRLGVDDVTAEELRAMVGEFSAAGGDGDGGLDAAEFAAIILADAAVGG